jgi:hypothetical protein
VQDTNPYTPPPDLESNASAVNPSVPSRFRDLLAAVAAFVTLYLMVAGYDWRDGPPPAVEFIVMISFAAIGFGLGLGSFRDTRSSTSSTLLGICCHIICGLFLARGLFGLLQGSLRGFAW